MKIHEYQAKGIFKSFQIPTEKFILCQSVDEVVEAFESMNSKEVMLKAQVLTGGRFKKGGIKKVDSLESARQTATEIFSMQIDDYLVEEILVSEAVDIKSEYYLSFTIDRTTKSIVLIASASGGVDIEEVVASNPDAVYRIPINPFVGIPDYTARECAFKLTSDYSLVKQITPIIQNLYELFVCKDATLAEINPLAVTTDGVVLAIDGKMVFDANAFYRQPDVVDLHTPTEAEIKENIAKEKGFSFVQLDGNIGCLVNGAGLAMTTNDLIEMNGAQSANFLDIGGSSTSEKVVQAFDLLLEDDKVGVFLVSIFGGITRCDDVARGLIEALKKVKVVQPIIVRLTGTNEKEARELLKDEAVVLTDTMEDAIKLAVFAIESSKTNL